MKIHVITIALFLSISHLVVAGGEEMPKVRSIEVRNGVTLEYVEQGTQSGIPLILLHGYTDSWHSFETVMRELPANLHVYAISQRGHGNSSRPEMGYTSRDFSEDIVAFMHKLHITQAYIGGHSMGGVVAQQIVLDHPAMIKGLIIISSDASFGKNPGMDDFLDVINNLQDPIDPEFAKGFQQRTLTQSIASTYFDTLVKESLKVPARVWKETLNSFMYVDFEEDLKRVMCPVLVIWGDQDGLCSRDDQAIFEKSLKKVKLNIYQGAGHAVHWEEPGSVARDILQFIHHR